MNFMVVNHLKHQENGTSNIHKFTSNTPAPKNSTAVSEPIGETQLSCIFPLEYPSDSVPDPENTPIKSIADDEMYQILEIFNSYHDDDILDVYI